MEQSEVAGIARVHLGICTSQHVYISACVHFSMLCHMLRTSVLTSAPLRKISGAAQAQQPSPAGHAPALTRRLYTGETVDMAGPKAHAASASASGPVTKRQKLHIHGEKTPSAVVRQSKIFAPFRVCLYTFTVACPDC